MKVKNSTIPADSLINKYLPANYSDAFECEITTEKEITADDILISLWTDMPDWVNKLFKLRNLLVKPFGLQAGEKEKPDIERCIRTGEKTNHPTKPLCSWTTNTSVLTSPSIWKISEKTVKRSGRLPSYIFITGWDMPTSMPYAHSITW